MDFHVEQLVTKKKTAIDWVKVFGICFLTAALWIVVIMFLLNFGLIAAALLVFIGWGAFRLIQTVSVEYEYELTNYYLDIDKIMGRARRKRIVSVDFHNIELCAYVTDSAFGNTHGIEKVYDLSGKPDAEGRAFIDCIGEDGKKIRVIIRPCEKLIECIRKAAPKTSSL